MSSSPSRAWQTSAESRLCSVYTRYSRTVRILTTLREYLKIAQGGQTHHCLPAAFAMHDTLQRKGDMHLTDFSEYVK